jgi:membrane protease YdiL (CAAX protease family)
MPEWATFVGFTFVVTSGLLVLSHLSSGVLADGTAVADRSAPTAESGDSSSERSDADGVDRLDADERDPDWQGSGGADLDSERVVLPKSGVAYRPAEPRTQSRDGGDKADALSTTSLLLNVAVSQGLFGVLLLVGAWYAEIPLWAFGAGPETTGLSAVATGTGLGVALYLANEAGAFVGARFGLDVGDGQRLRGALAPDTPLGWALLLLVVLPVIAGFEEILFRGALVGVVAAGYDVSPWAMAIVASGAFALGHGAQGRLGVVVTGALGLVLAAAFVLTGSLLVVIVAHYLVNTLEFVIHEGIGIEWPPDTA